MEFCSLYSGSSGNCLYVASDRTNLLVDAGVSGKRIQDSIKDIGKNPSEIGALLITHEHDDHIRAAGILSRRFDIPIYASCGTWKAMIGSLGKIKEENIKVFDVNSVFRIGDIYIKAFSIPHDASQPCGYSLINGKSKISIATDIGHMDDTIKDNIKDSDLILLEANHDVEMLKVGPYPYELKRRILSDVGHLSNENAGRTIVDILNSKIKTVMLGHLSKINNYPELAHRTVLSILEMNKISQGKDVTVEMADREKHSKVYSI